jgi:DNA mismatch endonuclease Vsr
MSPDQLLKEKRRNTMWAVKSSGSQIEQKLQKALWQKGFRYRKNYKGVFGKPDIAFVRLKIAVFVDSEFWHGFDWNNRKYDFITRRDFWWKKIERNISRDKQVTEELNLEGWIVVRFWGKDVDNDLDQCVTIVSDIIEQRRHKA